MTATQAAARCGVTVPGLMRAVDRGALLPAAFTVKGARLFAREDVERIRKAREALKLADRRRPPPT